MAVNKMENKGIFYGVADGAKTYRRAHLLSEIIKSLNNDDVAAWAELAISKDCDEVINNFLIECKNLNVIESDKICPMIDAERNQINFQINESDLDLIIAEQEEAIRVSRNGGASEDDLMGLTIKSRTIWSKLILDKIKNDRNAFDLMVKSKKINNIRNKLKTIKNITKKDLSLDFLNSANKAEMGMVELTIRIDDDEYLSSVAEKIESDANLCKEFFKDEQ